MLTARPMCRQGSNSRHKLCNSSRKQRGSQPSTAPTSHQLQLLVANVCGLMSKMVGLRHVMHSLLPDVIIPETKITSDKCSDNDIMIPSYSASLRRDGTSHGGGVAVWVKSGTAYQYLESIQCYDHEVLWLSVAAKYHGHFVAGAVYRPSSCHGDTQLPDYLDTTINEAERYGSHIVIAGDFNVHNQSWLGSSKTTRAGELMEEICSLHAVYQHNTRLEYARHSHLQLHLPGRHEWGTPTTYQSLQDSPSPFSESQ